MTIEERFWSKVDTSGVCWNWTAATNNMGYGVFGIDRGLVYAHRFAYSLVHGDIPEGLFVCHHCDNPRCVKPRHLFVGTQGDNMRDSVAKGRARQHHSQGEDHASSKISEKDVHEIRRLYATGRVSHRALAKMWQMSHTHIGYIIRRQSWKHI